MTKEQILKELDAQNEFDLVDGYGGFYILVGLVDDDAEANDA